MPSVYPSPVIQAKRSKLRLELALLKLKEKMFGKLSSADEERRRRIMRELCIFT